MFLINQQIDTVFFVKVSILPCLLFIFTNAFILLDYTILTICNSARFIFSFR